MKGGCGSYSTSQTHTLPDSPGVREPGRCPRGPAWVGREKEWGSLRGHVKENHDQCCSLQWITDPPSVQRHSAHFQCVQVSRWQIHMRRQRTVPLQKSTTVYPGLANSVTMATKLFSCCRFLTARTFDIFPAKRFERKKERQKKKKFLMQVSTKRRATGHTCLLPRYDVTVSLAQTRVTRKRKVNFFSAKT